AVLVWKGDDGANHWFVRARGRSTSGSMGPERDLSVASQNAGDAQVAVEPGGNAVAVWDRSDGLNDRVQAAFLLNEQTLSAGGQDALDERVAVDTRGNAVVVWARSDGLNDRVQVRRRAASGASSATQTLS